MSKDDVQQALQRMRTTVGFTPSKPPKSDPAQQPGHEREVTDALARMRSTVGVPFTVDITNERKTR
ncbi:hypothetical protein ACFY2Y_09430 [Janibacter hoylei]|uniref:hypothetical protein n=1 Tax=Janibacter hoylei TaxID=364298 RepID=UPI00368C6056